MGGGGAQRRRALRAGKGADLAGGKAPYSNGACPACTAALLHVMSPKPRLSIPSSASPAPPPPPRPQAGSVSSEGSLSLDEHEALVAAAEEDLVVS